MVGEQGADCRSLVRGERRNDLEHFAPVACDEPAGTGALGDGVELRERSLLVGRVAIVECSGQRLVLEPGPRQVCEELVEARRPRGGLRCELEAVIADVDEVGHADDRARGCAVASRDASDERVVCIQPP